MLTQHGQYQVNLIRTNSVPWYPSQYQHSTMLSLSVATQHHMTLLKLVWNHFCGQLYPVFCRSLPRPFSAEGTAQQTSPQCSGVQLHGIIQWQDNDLQQLVLRDMERPRRMLSQFKGYKFDPCMEYLDICTLNLVSNVLSWSVTSQYHVSLFNTNSV